MAASRPYLPALLKRPESNRTGVYILLGDGPEALDERVAYIGEADNVGNRLKRQAADVKRRGKDSWDQVVVLTSKDDSLTKAHARYLESRLIEIARQAGRAQILNGTTPQRPPLSEADITGMEYFIDQVHRVLPLLEVQIFRSTIPAAQKSAGKPGFAIRPSPIFELTLVGERIQATAQEIDGEFTVRAGSLARSSWVGVGGGYELLRMKLEEDGTLAVCSDGISVRFTRDHVFASPSAAAAVVLGRSANGRIEWKVADSRTSYADWQLQSLETPTPEVE
jgi:hypothetical protein